MNANVDKGTKGRDVGYNAGEGKLYFEDREYPFSVQSIKVGTIGVSKVQAIGSVYNLNDIADFEGRYGALDAGMTLIQGGNVAVLENKKGVKISLQTYQHGAEVSLSASGIDIVLQKAAIDEAQTSTQAVNKYYQKTELPPIQLKGQIPSPSGLERGSIIASPAAE